jgi:hypothetical protein
LTAGGVEILKSMKKLASDDGQPEAYVFPGAKLGRPLSNMAFLMLLRRMGRDDLTGSWVPLHL